MPSNLFPVPKGVRLIVLVTCLAVLVSAVGLAIVAAAAPLLAPDQKPNWALFGFELVIVVASVQGVFFGRGRFAQAPGLTLACVGGAILVASALGWAGSGKQLLGHSLKPVLAFRVLTGASIAGCGALCVLLRDPRSFRPAAVGAACLIPVVVGSGAVLLPRVRLALDHAFKAQQGLCTAGAVLAFIAAGVLLSAGVHLLIKAFEMGRGPGLTSDRA